MGNRCGLLISAATIRISRIYLVSIKAWNREFFLVNIRPSRESATNTSRRSGGSPGITVKREGQGPGFFQVAWDSTNACCDSIETRSRSGERERVPNPPVPLGLKGKKLLSNG